MIQHVVLGQQREPGYSAFMGDFGQSEVTSQKVASQLASPVSKPRVKPDRPVPQNREALVDSLGRRSLKDAAVFMIRIAQRALFSTRHGYTPYSRSLTVSHLATI